ncbi:hypothetical protein B0A55_01107 [Friedmanniomyces simplex]|uniref:RRM domain-containing protein n=1 Tax=Friedmanniomyces simplex TaxID=329884 RepID=A0A4U0XXS3_9PEZI|nr:hypothetical protein B0A55_01107 [Friedmanniomyces simplex]
MVAVAGVVKGVEGVFVLRRVAVKALALQPSRQLSTLRPQATRVTTLKPTLLRSFHQSRLWLAEQDVRSDEASPAEAETSGETVTTEPSAAEEQIKEESVLSHDTTGGNSEPTATDSGPALNTSSYDANAMPSYTSEGSTEFTETQREPARPEQSESFTSQAQDLASSAAQTVQSTAASVSQTARAAYDRTADRAQQPRRGRDDQFGSPRGNDYPGRSQQDFPPPRRSNNDAPPSRILYVGNLFFEVTAPQLEAEFATFGVVTNSRVVTDARGLSKGFAYVEFEDQAAADQAKRELNQKVFQGRRLAVQYHMRREPRDMSGGGGGGAGRERREPSAPTKTLFIGNMSYQMSDKDLNDLFREIRNVLDVRVAIDRRSGQPRGFAHADFVDVASAERGKEMLASKVIYGRQLKVDFSAGSSGGSRGEGGGGREGREGRGSGSGSGEGGEMSQGY